MSLVRRLNETGLQRLTGFLHSLKAGIPQSVPADVLTHSNTSESIGVEIEIEHRAFASRLEAAKYLDERLSSSGLRNIDRDRGLWAWLSLFYFEELCPPDEDGRREPGDLARWIPELTNELRYFRHLLAGPYLVYRVHRDNPRRAMVLLCGPVDVVGQFVDDLAPRKQIVTNKAIMEAATSLYIDPETLQPKRGARTKGPGGPRRLAAVINQLDLTWDLYAMTTENFLECLPAEFDRFRSSLPGIRP